MRDINHETGNEGPEVTSLQFHPKSTVAFVAGLSKKLSIFKVSNNLNKQQQLFMCYLNNINKCFF